MIDIITVGEVLIDLTQTGVTPQSVPLLAANPGGAPANVAVAAARLGAHCAFVGKTGRDGFGGYLAGVLRENGVDVSNLRTGDAPTTMAVVTVAQGGERSFRFVRGADADLSPEELDAAALAQGKVLHFGSVSLTREPARTATLCAARTARENGLLVSYDPNYRAPLWPSREEAVQRMREPLELADIVKLSDEELELLTDASTPEQAALCLQRQGVQLVLVTLGAGGCFYRWQNSSGLVPGGPTIVADTNGAGDTFLGAVLSRLVQRGERPLDGLQTSELEQILSFANRAAALTCSRSGAIPAMPTLAELK